MVLKFISELANNRYDVHLQDTIEYNGNTYDEESFLSFLRKLYRDGIPDDIAELLTAVSSYLVNNGYNDYIEKIRHSDINNPLLALPAAIAFCMYDLTFLRECCVHIVDSFIEHSGIYAVYELQKTNQFVPYETITSGISLCGEVSAMCTCHLQVIRTVHGLILDDLELEREKPPHGLSPEYATRYFQHKENYLQEKYVSSLGAYQERDKKILTTRGLYEKSLLDFSGELARRIAERLTLSAPRRTYNDEVKSLASLSPEELIARYETFHKELARGILPKPGVAAFSLGGKLYIGLSDGTVLLTDAKRHFRITKRRRFHHGSIISLDASAHVVCSLDSLGQICVFDEKLRLLSCLSIRGAVCVFVSPLDQAFAVTAHLLVYQLDIQSSTAIVCSPSFSFVNAGDMSFRIPSFPDFPYRLQCVADKPSSIYCNMYICGNTGRAALGFSNGNIYLDNGSNGAYIPSAHEGAVLDVQVFGGYAFSAGIDGTIRMWRMMDFSCLYIYRPDAPVLSISVTSDSFTATLGDGSIVSFSYLLRHASKPYTAPRLDG